MSSVRNNHYIPRFYLRNFTDDPTKENGILDFYNIKSSKYIGKIPHGPQMQERYFYEKGSDIDEKLDKNFERKHASVIKGIVTNVSKFKNSLLIEIVLLMHFRTRVRRDIEISLRKSVIDAQLDNLTQSFKSHLVKKNLFQSHELDDGSLKEIVKDSSYENYLKATDISEKQINHFKRLHKEIRDLTATVLVNTSSTELISSDSPVLQINPFLFKRKVKFGKNGLYQIGALLILPINPKRVVVCYDANVYRNPLELNGGLLSESDVINLNNLQILSSAEGIYSKNLPDNIQIVVKDNLKKKKEPVTVVCNLKNGYQLIYTDSKLPNYDFNFIKEKEDLDKIVMRLPYARSKHLRRISFRGVY